MGGGHHSLYPAQSLPEFGLDGHCRVQRKEFYNLKLDDKFSQDESGQISSREKSIWYSVLLDNIDLWSALKIAQKDSWWFGYLGYDLKKSHRELKKWASRII